MIKIFKKLFNTDRPNVRDWEGWYKVEKYLTECDTLKFKELKNTNYEKIKRQNDENKHQIKWLSFSRKQGRTVRN